MIYSIKTNNQCHDISRFSCPFVINLDLIGMRYTANTSALVSIQFMQYLCDWNVYYCSIRRACQYKANCISAISYEQHIRHENESNGLHCWNQYSFFISLNRICRTINYNDIQMDANKAYGEHLKHFRHVFCE